MSQCDQFCWNIYVLSRKYIDGLKRNGWAQLKCEFVQLKQIKI